MNHTARVPKTKQNKKINPDVVNYAKHKKKYIQ